jgi:nitroimidazol reductase NimA-like FMN-containing flavoprotein (pyridoxamine 5'-phosphate oxidase superfamily)
MRRKDREITDRAEIEAVIREATVCRIGLSDGREPYVVPLSFGYEDRSVYIHSAREASKNLSGSSPVSSLAESGGKKITMIRKNPRCCFEVDICDGLVKGDRPCSWGMRYRSVIGYGRAAILTNPGEKMHGLNCIMQHYGSGTYDFSDRDLDSVTVIRIALESMTGKKHD